MQEQFLTLAFEYLLDLPTSDAQGVVDAMNPIKRSDVCAVLRDVLKNIE